MWLPPRLDPSDVVFLSGAGISADAPTNGPIGLELTRRALSLAFLPHTGDELAAAYGALGFPGSRVPRLEAILEIAVQVHGLGVLEDLLSDIAKARPNRLHEFFGEHMVLGGAHITANFDKLIERAAPGVMPLHFHGAIEEAGAVERLGARLSRIERGFDPTMRIELEEALLQPAGRTLVVVGYSGLDFFDFDPFLASHTDRLSVAIGQVIWVVHDPHTAVGQIEEVSRHEPPALRTFATAGVPTTIVAGLTSTVLDALSVHWGTRQIGQLHRDGVRWNPTQDPAALDKGEATRRLYLHMGLYRAHQSLVATTSELEQLVTAGDRAAIAWQEGRHRKARRQWALHYQGHGSALRARRLERAAACRWDHGAYLRAYLTSLLAVRVAQDSDDVEIQAISLETQARILIHMGRLADLRWFATNARRERVAQRLELMISSYAFGSNLRPRLSDAAELLRQDPERTRSALPATGHEKWSRSYEEYESLSGVLDYRRGEMRRAVADGTEQMTRTWLDDYRSAAQCLGKQAAIATIPTLPGAAACLGFTEGLSLLVRARASPWHRVRMVAMFALRRATVALSALPRNC